MDVTRLETLILNEVTQKEKDKYYMISLICGIKKIEMNLLIKQKQEFPSWHSG